MEIEASGPENAPADGEDSGSDLDSLLDIGDDGDSGGAGDDDQSLDDLLASFGDDADDSSGDDDMDPELAALLEGL